MTASNIAQQQHYSIKKKIGLGALGALAIVGLVAIGGMGRTFMQSRMYGGFGEYGDGMQMARPAVLPPQQGGVDMGSMDGIESMDKMLTTESSYMPDYGWFPPGIWYPQPDMLDEDMRLYTRSANYEVIARDVSEYTRSVRQQLEQLDARIMQHSVNSGREHRSGFITAKVPTDRFDQALELVKASARSVESESVDIQDITGTVISSQDRLAQFEERILELELQLEAVAEGSAEWRRINNQLQRMQQELEYAKQQAESAGESVAYAQLHIAVFDQYSYYSGRYHFDGAGWPDLRTTAYSAWLSLQYFGMRIAEFVIWAVVYSVIWVPVLGVGVLVWRRWRR